MDQAGFVDAMAEPRRKVPLRRYAGIRERIGGHEQRLDGDHFIFFAMREFKEIAKKQSDIRTLERRKADLDAEWKRISEDQDRTRKNMSAIDRNTDLYARYMKKLGEQETQGEKIGAENIDLTDKLRKSQEDLNKYLSELNVE